MSNFNQKAWSEKRRRLFEQRAQLDADIKENGLEGKVFGMNVTAFDKWLKAEIKDANTDNGKPAKAIEKLIGQTVDQVVYGESLGHDLGMFQKSEADQNSKVENNSNSARSVSSPASRAAASSGSLPVTEDAGADVAPHHPPAIPQAEGCASSSGEPSVEQRVYERDQNGVEQPPDIPDFLLARKKEGAHG